MQKRIYLESLGCAKNQVDSEILLSYAIDRGYEVVSDPGKASLIVVNSCGFIEDAKKESIETVLSFRKLYPHAYIVLAGCLSERYMDQMDFEEVDAMFGNRNLSEFPKVLEASERRDKYFLHPDYPGGMYDERCDRKILLSLPKSAYLKISEGCNHRCAYCAIPIIRGSLRSRPKESLVKEAEELLKSGVYEINIVAQDLAAYGTDWDGKSHFVDLMDALSSLDGDFVLRMLYIHPDFFPFELLELIKERKKILPYFDIPIQHVDEKVLRPMGRVGDEDTYLDLIGRIRHELPDAVIRSTLMLGFPGEDDESFALLEDFVRKADLDWLGTFLYSREEGTAAWKMRNKKEHDKAHKKARSYQMELEKIQGEVSRKRASMFVGKRFGALVEEKIEGGDALSFGRIYSQAPEVDGVTVIVGGDLKPGDVVDVEITKSMDFDLEGKVIG